MRINGEAVRQLREARELTVTELATRVGLKGHSHLANIEAQRRQASPTLIKAIARELHVPYIALLGPEKMPDDEQIPA